MRTKDNSRKGIAAIEFAVMLPAVALVLILMVEGASAMHAYSSLVEASREGARLALMDSASTDIEALVEAVTAELGSKAVTTSVTTDSGLNTVTVEVSYDYQPFGEDAFKMLTGEKSMVFAAQTTMPLP